MYFRFILQRGSTRWKGDSNPRSPLREDAFGTATLPGWDRLEPHLLPRGTEGSNPLSSTSESLSAVIFAIPGTARAGRASCSKFAKLLEQEAGVVDPVPGRFPPSRTTRAKSHPTPRAGSARCPRGLPSFSKCQHATIETACSVPDAGKADSTAHDQRRQQLVDRVETVEYG